MRPHEIFGRYAKERRTTVPTGYKADIVSGLTRYTPVAPALDGIVMLSELSASLIDDAITAQIAYFRSLGRPFEWKVFRFDSPADLADRLKARGFEQGAIEAFMVYDVGAHKPCEQLKSIRIERITTAEGIRHVTAIQEEVWGRSFEWLESSLSASLAWTAIYCAYSGKKPVGCGWIELPEGSTFAELHGGAVLPAVRNRGIYSAVFDVRVEEAKRRGLRFLAVDAAPMSRPILLNKGFQYVCDTIPFRKNG